MDDLDLVRVVYQDAFPIFFPHDFPVQFNRNAFRRQSEFFEKFEQIHLFRDFFRFAVDKNFHDLILSNQSAIQNHQSKINLALTNDLTKFGFFAVADGAHENRAASRTKLR